MTEFTEIDLEVKNPTLEEIETTIRPWSVERFKAWALKYSYTESDVDQWLSERMSEQNPEVRIQSNETK